MFSEIIMVDYRNFRISKLKTPEFSHLKLLIFWPLFGIAFALLERAVNTKYTIMYCRLDDMIPFCEYFLIPYTFWFVFLVGMYIYSLLYDIETFKKYTYFIIITYTITLLIYIFWPTAQELRPASFERDNIFTRFIAAFYNFDTNTNVCPSIHVIGSVAVLCAAWHSKHFSKTGWRIAFSVVTFLIIISTVFLKQHSVLDIPPALLLCAIAYPFVYWDKLRIWIAGKFLRL